MIEVKTSELVGPALDWAAAKATGAQELKLVQGGGISCIYQLSDGGCWTSYYRPSTDWSQGGPLIESEQIELKWDGVDGEAFIWMAAHQDRADAKTGVTPLIAACRAIVAARLGDTVQIPDELAERAEQ